MTDSLEEIACYKTNKQQNFKHSNILLVLSNGELEQSKWKEALLNVSIIF